MAFDTRKIRNSLLATMMLIPAMAQASAIAIDFTALISGGTDPNDNVSGTYISAGISNGDTIVGAFIFDNDASKANSSSISDSVSEFLFVGAPYGATISVDSGYNFVSDSVITVEVQNDKFIDGNGVNGHVAAGTYDVVGLFGTIGDEEEWTINILGSASWFSDATLIPASLPNDYKVFLQADDYDSGSGVSIGTVLTSFDQNSVSVSSVPIPAAVWLFGSGLIGLIGVARRKKA
jgi:hypothetical protein